MSYNYLTQWDSPNYTPGNQTRAVWGVDRQIRAIAIHWWDDPTRNPSFEGVIATLTNPARQASAHYVATGTGRRVACLVSPNDNSWATNSQNPYTISIECDPRCRDEDYDVVAELIADIRSAYGEHLPLIGHRDVVATRCPGNWDLGRLDALARNKWSHATEWGQGGTKNTTPTPPPAPAGDNLFRLFVDGNQVSAYSVEENAYKGWVNYGSKGTIKLNGNDVTAAIVEKYKPAPEPEQPKPEPETPKPEPEQPTEPEQPPKEDPKPDPVIPPVETPDQKISWLYALLSKIWEAILAYLSKNINRVK